MAAQRDDTPTGPSGAVEEAGPKTQEADAAAPDPNPPPAAAGRRRFRYTLPGAWGALVFACLAFTPSLLPRGALLQGVVCGINAAIGYGVGVAGAWIWRAFADRDPRPPRPEAWRVFAISAAVLLVVAIVLGQWWQAQLRDLMGAPAPNPLLLLLLPPVAAAIFAGLVALSRSLRGAYHRAAVRLERWMGPRAARALGWVAVVTATWLVASGLLLNGLAGLADRSFSVRNTTTAEGVDQPTSGLRSGGPGSLVSWESLGRQGRTITGTGPSAKEIAAWRGSSQAPEPIRAYAGTLSAEDVEERADLAVEDLERAGGFTRTNLLVATTTGSGWLDPGAIDSFEYLTGGDSAVVAMQYSYLPSWLSYLVDQKKAREAGRQLFDAVYDRWSKLPRDQRPRLFVFGLSLGSFGGETAFSGEYDLRNRTAGALFAGPPNFNTLYREFTDDRDPPSREVEPVYRGGRSIRFTNDVAAGVPPSAAWEETRILYLQHPSDPIVWWGPSLLWDRPDWLGEPPGRDVLDSMVWIPLVTFWQVTVDLPMAAGVPDGHGHTYTREFVDGWAEILQPPGWTPDKAERLRDTISMPE